MIFRKNIVKIFINDIVKISINDFRKKYRENFDR